MKFFEVIGSNPILNAVFFGWVTAQVLKTIINFFDTKKWDSERLIGSGGMPSSHSAVVCALVMKTSEVCGFSSPEFALAVAFAAIVMYDAMGVRRAAGEQAKLLNKIAEEWFEQIKNKESINIEDKKLKELLGHTPLEVLGGALVGIIVGMIV